MPHFHSDVEYLRGCTHYDYRSVILLTMCDMQNVTHTLGEFVEVNKI